MRLEAHLREVRAKAARPEKSTLRGPEVLLSQLVVLFYCSEVLDSKSGILFSEHVLCLILCLCFDTTYLCLIPRVFDGEKFSEVSICDVRKPMNS